MVTSSIPHSVGHPKQAAATYRNLWNYQTLDEQLYGGFMTTIATTTPVTYRSVGMCAQSTGLNQLVSAVTTLRAVNTQYKTGAHAVVTATAPAAAAAARTVTIMADLMPKISALAAASSVMAHQHRDALVSMQRLSSIALPGASTVAAAQRFAATVLLANDARRRAGETRAQLLRRLLTPPRLRLRSAGDTFRSGLAIIQRAMTGALPPGHRIRRGDDDPPGHKLTTQPRLTRGPTSARDDRSPHHVASLVAPIT